MNNERVPIFRLFERRTSNNELFYSGRWGEAAIVMFRDREADPPRYGSDGEWVISVMRPAARPTSPRPAYQPRPRTVRGPESLVTTESAPLPFDDPPWDT